MHQQGQDLVALLVALDRLHRADLPEHDRIDRFEMRRIREQRKMDLDSLELAVRGGAEVVFDVARAADVGRVGRTAGELVEDRPVRLAHNVRQDVEPAAVRHADVDLLDAAQAAVLDDGLERRNRALAAVESEPLRADIFAGEKLFPLLGLDDLGEDRLLALGRKGDLGVLAFHPCLEESALVHIIDVHVLEADVAAVVCLQHGDDLADGSGFETQRSGDVDGPVEVAGAEAVIFRREIGRHVP